MSVELLIYTTFILSGFSCILIPLLTAKNKSLAAFIIVLLNAVVSSFPAFIALTGTIENKKYRELITASIFPSERSYVSSYLEFFENRIFEPVIYLFLRFLNSFTFIHNREIQLHVLSGFFFIIIPIIFSFLNIL